MREREESQERRKYEKHHFRNCIFVFFFFLPRHHPALKSVQAALTIPLFSKSKAQTGTEVLFGVNEAYLTDRQVGRLVINSASSVRTG